MFGLDAGDAILNNQSYRVLVKMALKQKERLESQKLTPEVRMEMHQWLLAAVIALRESVDPDPRRRR